MIYHDDDDDDDDGDDDDYYDDDYYDGNLFWYLIWISARLMEAASSSHYLKYSYWPLNEIIFKLETYHVFLYYIRYFFL